MDIPKCLRVHILLLAILVFNTQVSNSSCTLLGDNVEVNLISDLLHQHLKVEATRKKRQAIDIGGPLPGGGTGEEIEPSADCEEGKLDLYFVVDNSDNINTKQFNGIIEFFQVWLRYVKIGDSKLQVGMITSGTQPDVLFNLKNYTTKEEILNAVNTRLKHTGGEAKTLSAMALMLDSYTIENGDRSDANNVAILITGGPSPSDTVKAVEILSRANQEQVNLWAIGIETSVFTRSDLIALDPEIQTKVVKTEGGLKSATLELLLAIQQCPKFEICEEGVADMVILIDESCSLTVQDFEGMKTFITSLLPMLSVHPNLTRVAIATFGDTTTLKFHLNEFENHNDIIGAVAQFEQNCGATNTSGAIRYMRERMFTTENGDRSNISNIAIIITDGVSTVDERYTAREAQIARSEGIAMFMVGVGAMVDTKELKLIASKPHEKHLFQVTDYYGLMSITNTLASKTCYVPGCAFDKVDVVFVLDVSGSLSDESFKHMMLWVASFVEVLEVGPHAVQFGLITFSTTVKIDFYLNTYSNRQDVLDALSQVQHMKGTTDTKGAVATMRDIIFTENNGDREGILNVAVVLTDGASKTGEPGPEAYKAKENGIYIFAIGIVTPELDKDQLTEMSSEPEEVFLVLVNSTEELLKGNAQQRASVIRCSPPPEEPPIDPTSTAQPVTIPSTIAPTSSTSASFTTSCPYGTADIFIILGVSGEEVIPFLRDIIMDLDIGNYSTNIAVITFNNSSPHTEIHLSEYTSKADILNAIDAFPTMVQGDKILSEALEEVFRSKATRKKFRDHFPSICVIFADHTLQMGTNILQISETLHENGTEIVLVKVGDPPIEIDAIIKQKDVLYTLDGFTELHEISKNITENVCRQRSACPASSAGLDIALLLDTSSSVEEGTLLDAIYSAKQLTKLLPETYRVGVITFSDTAEVQFYLTSYTSTENITEAISQIQASPGATNIAAAFTSLGDIFNIANGDSELNPNVAVLMSDGVATVDTELTYTYAQYHKDSNVRVISLGIGPAIDVQSLEALASGSLDVILATDANFRNSILHPFWASSKFVMEITHLLFAFISLAIVAISTISGAPPNLEKANIKRAAWLPSREIGKASDEDWREPSTSGKPFKDRVLNAVLQAGDQEKEKKATWLPTKKAMWLPTKKAMWLPTKKAMWLPTKKATWLPTKREDTSKERRAMWLPTKKATWLPTKKATWLPTKKAHWLPTKKAHWLPTKKAHWLPTKRATWLPTKKAQWLNTRSMRSVDGLERSSRSLWFATRELDEEDKNERSMEDENNSNLDLEGSIDRDDLDDAAFNGIKDAIDDIWRRQLAGEGKLNPDIISVDEGSDNAVDKRGGYQGLCFRRTASGHYIPKICWRTG
ncbi:unnamed protein product [Owenia fusiformis]|uniref:Uncharacterized protein n=1 Tax=Owenia fusiformis TaxID=6347 RepID=A0A8J1XRA2_OWEFU|nr:unnamed protein product [Owenia fusiformis]